MPAATRQFVDAPQSVATLAAYFMMCCRHLQCSCYLSDEALHAAEGTQYPGTVVLSAGRQQKSAYRAFTDVQV